MENIINYLPWLMWVGFALRMFWHNINKDYPFNRSTEVGVKNIKLAVFSALVNAVFFMFFLTIKMDDSFDTSNWTGILLLIVFIVFYLGWGWFSDVLFLKLMSKFEKKSEEIMDKTIDGKIEGVKFPEEKKQ